VVPCASCVVPSVERMTGMWIPSGRVGWSGALQIDKWLD
jgi:hypothetical protein